MFKLFYNYLLDMRARQGLAIAVSKGGAMMNSRKVDLKNPESWEFAGFSQNGEDGILDVLRSQLKTKNKYVIEIGSSDGVQNNSSWLIVFALYNGLMIEGNKQLVERAKRLIQYHGIGAEYLNMFVDRENIQTLKEHALHTDPDVFSLDIDGVDYYIADEILKGGFRPKIFIVEYNSVFGPDRSITVPYKKDFDFGQSHETKLYYGVSIAAWRNFFEKNGYKFVTVDQKGVNAVFVDPTYFDAEFLKNINGLDFAENGYQYKKFRMNSEKQFQMIKDLEYFTVK